jgi:predicted nucleic acid-binding protein
MYFYDKIKRICAFIVLLTLSHCSTQSNLEYVQKENTKPQLKDQEIALLIRLSQEVDELNRLAKVATLKSPSQDIFNYSIHLTDLTNSILKDLYNYSIPIGQGLSQIGMIHRRNHWQKIDRIEKDQFDQEFLEIAYQKQMDIINTVERSSLDLEAKEHEKYVAIARSIEAETVRLKTISNYIEEYASLE